MTLIKIDTDLVVSAKKEPSFAKVIGPGLLFAGSAVGVSHLVQSTRAGALYGLGLVPGVRHCGPHSRRRLALRSPPHAGRFATLRKGGACTMEP